jgi:hypothetical protein
MKRAAVALAFAVLLGLASPAPGCSVSSLEPGDVIENPRFDSANGSFTLVARQYPAIPDFGTMTAGELFGLTDDAVSPESDFEAEFLFPEDYMPYMPEDPLERLGPAPWETPPSDDELPPVEVALYRNLEGGTHALVSEFTLDERFTPRFLAVADDGDFVVTWEPPAPFIMTTGGGPWFKPRIAIYDAADGELRSVEYPALLTADDLVWLGWATVHAESWQLREHPNTGTTVLHATFPSAAPHTDPVELDVDLATGRLLQPAADYYPPLGEVVVSAASPERKPAGIGCASGALVPTVGSQELLDRAKFSPAPLFTEVAFRAGVKGKVILEVVVDEEGRAICARTVKDLPFGLGEAAKKGIADWWFEPLVVDGTPTKYSGLVEVEFRLNRPE